MSWIRCGFASSADSYVFLFSLILICNFVMCAMRIAHWEFFLKTIMWKSVKDLWFLIKMNWIFITLCLWFSIVVVLMNFLPEFSNSGCWLTYFGWSGLISDPSIPIKNWNISNYFGQPRLALTSFYARAPGTIHSFNLFFFFFFNFGLISNAHFSNEFKQTVANLSTHHNV